MNKAIASCAVAVFLLQLLFPLTNVAPLDRPHPIAPKGVGPSVSQPQQSKDLLRQYSSVQGNNSQAPYDLLNTQLSIGYAKFTMEVWPGTNSVLGFSGGSYFGLPCLWPGPNGTLTTTLYFQIAVGFFPAYATSPNPNSDPTAYHILSWHFEGNGSYPNPASGKSTPPVVISQSFQFNRSGDVFAWVRSVNTSDPTNPYSFWVRGASQVTGGTEFPIPGPPNSVGYLTPSSYAELNLLNDPSQHYYAYNMTNPNESYLPYQSGLPGGRNAHYSYSIYTHNFLDSLLTQGTYPNGTLAPDSVNLYMPVGFYAPPTATVPDYMGARGVPYLNPALGPSDSNQPAGTTSGGGFNDKGEVAVNFYLVGGNPNITAGTTQTSFGTPQYPSWLNNTSIQRQLLFGPEGGSLRNSSAYYYQSNWVVYQWLPYGNGNTSSWDWQLLFNATMYFRVWYDVPAPDGQVSLEAVGVAQYFGIPGIYATLTNQSIPTPLGGAYFPLWYVSEHLSTVNVLSAAQVKAILDGGNGLNFFLDPSQVPSLPDISPLLVAVAALIATVIYSRRKRR